MASLLSIKNLVLAYDKLPVINNVSMEINPGRFIGLIGPNGAGKTTLLLSISGQFQPEQGDVRFSGQNIYKNNYEYKKQIGVVHENPFFYPHLTAIEFLVFVARLKGAPRHDIFANVDVLLKDVRLEGEKNKLCSQLSQGMRKKLAIAAALLGAPKILFLDEALNGVDVESAFHIKKLLADFVKAGGTVVLSTHVLEVIEKMCDRYLILKAGTIIADVDAKEFAEGKIDLEERVLGLLKDSKKGETGDVKRQT
jgi:ABC-2 type transport system ATP-binding protein